MGELSAVTLQPVMMSLNGLMFSKRQKSSGSKQRNNRSGGHQQNQDVVVIVKHPPQPKSEPSPLQKTASDILRKVFRLPATSSALSLSA